MSTWFQEPKERIVFWLIFYVLVLGAWSVMALMTIETEIEKGSLLEVLCGSAGQLSLLQLTTVWMLMMGAMMAPSFQSHIQTHMDIMSRSGQILPSIELMLGYLAIWLVLAIVGALMQQLLANLDLVDLSGRSMSLGFNSVLCLVAAIYQFSVWKKASLRKCASPMHYFFQHWRDGPMSGLRMGLHLGLWCAICCWALMLLAFVGGTMNVVWMALITALIVYEKYTPQTHTASHAVGQTLLYLSGLMFILWILLESS